MAVGHDLIVTGAPTYEQNTHLRRSLSEMDATRHALVDLDMAFWTATPTFPNSDHLDHTDFGSNDEPITARAKRYMEAFGRTQVDHGTRDDQHSTGIPAHKLASSDGWHVTNKECVEALRSYAIAMEAGRPHPDALRDDLIPFLRTAARYDGFRVY